MAARRAGLVLDREFAAVVRSPALWLLSAGYALTVVGLGLAGGASSYLSVVLDLLAPLQLLVPVLAVAFGYRAIRGDADRGELAVLRTYPVSRLEYVLGTYLGRLTALSAVVLAPLAVVGLAAAATGGPAAEFIATHAAGDTPLLVVRFAVLTALYAAVALSVVVALSAVAASARSALALGTSAVVLIGLGLDLVAVGLLSASSIPTGSLPWLVAASPASAYRGLVLASVGAGSATTARVAVAPLKVAGLVLWLLGALAVGIRAAWE